MTNQVTFYYMYISVIGSFKVVYNIPYQLSLSSDPLISGFLCAWLSGPCSVSAGWQVVGAGGRKTEA